MTAKLTLGITTSGSAMLVNCPSQPLGQQEDQGSCGEIEDFVKSFIPSLFDSDSDTEDAFFPQATSQVDSTLELPQTSRPLTISYFGTGNGKAESFSEASSPSSQGNSSHSTFQPPLDTSGSIDDQSTFQSVLSIASNGTVFDAPFEEERPVKRSKVSPARGPARASPPGDTFSGAAVSCKQEPDYKQPSGSPPPALPRPSSLQSLAPQQATAASGSLITGHLAPNARPAVPASVAPWGALPAPTGSPGLPSAPAPWPQGMIPTAPMAAFYQHQAAPSPPIPPQQTSSKAENVAAILDRLSKSPLPTPPLGLKLDKLSVMRQLKGIGMRATH